MVSRLSFQLTCQKHTSDLESLSSVITISPVVTSALLHIINCEHSIRSKNILICFRRTGRVRFFRHRPTAKLDIFSSTFLDSYQIVFSSSSAIFGLFFPSITSFHAYQSDIRVHKDLRCQIWICHKNERYILRIIRLRTFFLLKKYFCGRPGELPFRHPVRRKQTYYIFWPKYVMLKIAILNHPPPYVTPYHVWNWRPI